MASSSSGYSRIVGPKSGPALYDGLLIMMNVSTPWSEMEVDTPFPAWWNRQFKGCQFPSIVLRLNQQHEWVTAQSSRAGVNGLLKPFSGLDPKLRIGEQPSGSGTVKLVVRPVCLEDNPVNLGKLESDESLRRFFVLIDEECDTTVCVSRKDTLRSPPGSFWPTFGQTAVDALQVVRTWLINIDKRQPEGGKQAKFVQVEFETCIRLLDACIMKPPPAEATTSNVGPRRSTLFLPGDGRRIESPAQIMDSGCPCVAGSKFAEWLNLDCQIGHFIVTNNTIFDSLNQVIPIVLHALKFKLLSACRASPIEPINILRGVIDADSLDTLRVAGTAEDFLKPLSAEPSSTQDAWDMTDKHRVLWLLPTRDLHVAAVRSAIGKGKGKASAKGKTRGLLGDVDNARATKLWQAGSLHFAMSAPRSVIGRWRMSFVPPVPIEFAGEVVCLTLEWVGNKFFHHDCLRRAITHQHRLQTLGSWGLYF